MSRNKGKIIVLIVACILLSIPPIIFTTWYLSKEEINTRDNILENENIQDNSDSNNNIQEIIPEQEHLEEEETGKVIDKESGSVVYDPSQEVDDTPPPSTVIKAPENIDEGYISEYLKYFFFVYSEQSFSSFTDNQIATIVALSSELYQPRKESDVQKIAKEYFNIDNYVLPTGTYKLENYGEFTVSKENGYYFRSDIKNHQTSENSVFLIDTKVNENKVTLEYVYAKNSLYGEGYSPLNRDEKYIKGYYTIELTYTGDGYNVNSIHYRLK